MQQIALLLTIGLIIWLFRRDLQRRQGVSSASWLILIWLAIFASRPVSAWMASGQTAMTPDAYLEGNSTDRNVFFLLLLLAVGVLLQRKESLAAIVRQNKWMFVFYAYCCISVLWSEYPFVAFKRWYKDFGNVILLLVLLTEKGPVEAAKAVFARLAYLLVPLSFLWVRYYPDLGRTYTGWNKNDLMYIGVTTHKNTLGCLLLVACAFIVWDLTSRRNTGTRFDGLVLRADGIIVLLMAVWLLAVANSATSLLCTVLALVIYLGTGMKFLKHRLQKVPLYALAIAAAWFPLDAGLGITELVVTSLGRDMTFTGRSDAWEIVLATDINPLLGAGFKSFWAGERMAQLWTVLPDIVQAHNGYLETYLNLGLLGVFFLVMMLVSGFRKIYQHLAVGDDFSRIRLTFWIVVVIYNFSETAFSNLFLLWFITLLVVVGMPEGAEAPVAAAETPVLKPVLSPYAPRRAYQQLQSRATHLHARRPRVGTF